MKFRGNTQLAGGALKINPDMTCAKSSGIITVKRYPITPKDSFKLSVDFTLDEALTLKAKHKLVLLDNKYVIYPNAKQARYHKGFQIFLSRNSNSGKYTIAAALGFGKSSKIFYSNAIDLAAGKLQNIAVEFNAVGNIRFFANGKAAGDKRVPIGPIAASELALAIGDRYSSTYSPFTGSISKVELRKIPYNPVILQCQS